jgi:4-carboxymuconolactone decarboxylase
MDAPLVAPNNNHVDIIDHAVILRKRKDAVMGRRENADKTKERFGMGPDALAASFPEFEAVKDGFTYGEAWQQGDLDERTRFLVTAACLAVHGGDDLQDVLHGALKAGVEPVALQEVFHQIAPYVGFSAAQYGLAALKRVFDAEGVATPLEPQATVTEDTRLTQGLAVQKGIFGPAIDAMRAAAAPENMFMQDALSAYCFGDTYTRSGLSLEMRELLTFIAIISLGGCDPQAKAHATGNLAVGNSPALITQAVYQCVPYNGFPRSLNALSALAQALESFEQPASAGE